jgi:hypothetical protein
VVHRFSTVLAASLLFLAGSAAAQTLPVADAGDDQEIPCAPPTGAEVTLDGSGSSDPDDPLATLSYVWSGDAALGVGVTLEGVAPVVTLLPGVHVLTLTVNDGVDGEATDDVQITVVADSEPPTLVAISPSEAELWPPNHKLHAFAAADFVESVSDTCDSELGPEHVIFTLGTSDEDDNGNGDGNTTGDIVLECGLAWLRAERAGPGDGRVYELTLSAQDAAGNLSEPALLTVSVPHDRAHDAVDSGDVFEVTEDGVGCGPVELCPAVPSEACDDAGEAKVSIKSRGKHGQTLRWRANGFAAVEGEFSDDQTDYQLCVYTDDGVSAVLQDDPAAPHGRGWKQKGPGASFRGKQGGPHARLDGLKLKEKKGQGKLSLSVGGDDVALPELPLAPGESLVLQLHDSGGECLASTFDDPEKNTADRFEDRTDSN